MNNGQINHVHYASTYFKPDPPPSIKNTGCFEQHTALQAKQKILAAYQILISFNLYFTVINIPLLEIITMLLKYCIHYL
jgi:uncharacterized membrane protein YbaN (DUF454 family)